MTADEMTSVMDAGLRWTGIGLAVAVATVLVITWADRRLEAWAQRKNGGYR